MAARSPLQASSCINGRTISSAGKLVQYLDGLIDADALAAHTAKGAETGAEGAKGAETRVTVTGVTRVTGGASAAAAPPKELVAALEVVRRR